MITAPERGQGQVGVAGQVEVEGQADLVGGQAQVRVGVQGQVGGMVVGLVGVRLR